MIKGVNRQMIEVTHTGSPYFERAFLVVRSGGEVPPADSLHRLAEKVVQQADTYAGLKQQRRRQWLQRIGYGLACAGSGAGLYWLVQMVMG
ncbi:MAG: hypothetical protein IJ518_04950 [Clostridia bacterium]|nr:hypothetical protein [Clostridia bacterium]